MDGKRRWIPVAGGLVMAFSFGIPYAWSIFVAPLQAEFGWSRASVSLAQTLWVACTALATPLGGRWLDRAGPRRPALAGGILFASGLLLASRTASLGWLYLTYGVLTGTGAGLAYASPLSVAIRWFPDRPGLLSGIMVAGFGAGAAVVAPLAKGIVVSHGWRVAFAALGGGSMLLLVAGAILLRFPPHFRCGAGNGDGAAVGGKGLATRELAPGEMVRTTAFWRLFVSYAFGATAGLMVIGHAAPLVQMLAASPGRERLAGLSAAAVAFLAVGNGLGRVCSGWVSDRAGQARTLAMSMAGTTLLLLAVWRAFIVSPGTSAPLLLASLALAGAFYGSLLAIFPAVTARFFGVRRLGGNYGILFLAWGVAGVIGPMAGGRIFDRTGSYEGALLAASALAAAGALLVATARPPAIHLTR